MGQERNCLVDRVSLLLHDYQVNDGVLLIGCKSTWQCLKESHHGYVAVAHSILEFVAFVELNVTAVRKILKKTR